MRVFIGLGALAAVASVVAGQSVNVVVLQGPGYTAGVAPTLGTTSGTPPGIVYSSFSIRAGGSVSGSTYSSTGSTTYNTQQTIQTTVQNGVTILAGGITYSVNVPYTVTTLFFTASFTSTTANVAYTQSGTNGYLCDPCNNNGVNPTSSSLGNCQAAQAGPNYSQTALNDLAGHPLLCASLTNRVYEVQNLVAGSLTGFSIWASDVENTNGVDVANSVSFHISRGAIQYIGDPQIVGVQGQDFQVHGMPDEIFNMISAPNVQVNARFTYLSEAECPDNYTTCFAHPGTYISEQGIRVGKDKVHVVAGPAKKGLTVKVNGKKVSDKKTPLKLGSVEVVNHRRVVVKTPIATLTMTNSDKFMNQEMDLHDEKLMALGSQRRVLKAGQSFHPEVPLHGLQGQTWRNVEYPSGLEYEGSIMDYHVVDGNLFGTDFVFNQYKQ